MWSQDSIRHIELAVLISFVLYWKIKIGTSRASVWNGVPSVGMCSGKREGLAKQTVKPAAVDDLHIPKEPSGCVCSSRWAVCNLLPQSSLPFLLSTAISGKALVDFMALTTVIFMPGAVFITNIAPIPVGHACHTWLHAITMNDRWHCGIRQDNINNRRQQGSQTHLKYKHHLSTRCVSYMYENRQSSLLPAVNCHFPLSENRCVMDGWIVHMSYQSRVVSGLAFS